MDVELFIKASFYCFKLILLFNSKLETIIINGI